MSFKDHFSGHADIYREARPTYPPALFAWLAEVAPDTELAWDAGCGNGQATAALADRFAQVVGTDPSAAQIANAEPRPNIEYRVEPAEQTSLGPASASIATVAQALHWFDHPRYYAEVNRVVKRGGLVAVWAYAHCSSSDGGVDAAVDRLYHDLTGPYWPTERSFVETGYRTLPFPFVEIAVPEFPMVARWSVEHLLAYLRSWSATQRYIKARGEDPVSLVEPDLRAAWGAPARLREVRWQFHVRAGRV